MVTGLFALVSLGVANNIGGTIRDNFDFKFRSTLTDFRRLITRNKKTGILDLLCLQILAPTHFLFNFLFTVRYQLLAGALLNRMDIVMILILVTQSTRALALSTAYALYLNRDSERRNRPIVQALAVRVVKTAN